MDDEKKNPPDRAREDSGSDRLKFQLRGSDSERASRDESAALALQVVREHAQRANRTLSLGLASGLLILSAFAGWNAWETHELNSWLAKDLEARNQSVTACKAGDAAAAPSDEAKNANLPQPAPAPPRPIQAPKAVVPPSAAVAPPPAVVAKPDVPVKPDVPAKSEPKADETSDHGSVVNGPESSQDPGTDSSQSDGETDQGKGDQDK